MKTGSKLAIIVFVVVAVAHLLRLVFGVEITVGNWVTPTWVSMVGVLVPAGIAWILWRESQ